MAVLACDVFNHRMSLQNSISKYNEIAPYRSSESRGVQTKRKINLPTHLPSSLFGGCPFSFPRLYFLLYAYEPLAITLIRVPFLQSNLMFLLVFSVVVASIIVEESGVIV